MGGNVITYSMYGENIPVVLEDGEYILKVKCVENNSWYLTNKGNLYGCGDNSTGQQGSGDTTQVNTFTKRAENVKDFDCSFFATYTATVTWYLTNNGELYGCGWNDSKQQSAGHTVKSVLEFTKRADNVKSFACSAKTTWYIDNNGNLYGCGNAGDGAQGNGYTGTQYNVSKFTKRAENVKYVTCSDYTTWYIDNNNDLYGTGRNEYGQQGLGSTTDASSFTKRASNVKDIKCSLNTTWYLDNDNNLYGCGQNNYGQQGSGNTTQINTFTKRAENIKSFTCSLNTTFYIDSSNDLYGCGDNRYGQQGNGNTTNVLTFTKLELPK